MVDGLTDEQIQRVSRQWSQVRDRANHWSMLKASNRRFADTLGDPEIGPWGYLARKYIDPNADRLGRVLSLVCGQGHLERWLCETYDVGSVEAIDVSPPAIEIAKELAAEAQINKIDYRVGDVNQIALEGVYDLIMVSGGMHHVAELEHVYAEIRDHLARPHGVLLLAEYVGPRWTQCTPRQCDAINACIRLLPEKYRLTVSAQHELGVPDKESGMRLLRSRQSEMYRARARDWARSIQPIDLAKRVIYDGTTVRGTRPLHIACPPHEWHFAVGFPLPPRDPRDVLMREFEIVIDLEVHAGSVGVGCVQDDRRTYVSPEQVCTSADGQTRLRLTGSDAGKELVIRNVDTGGTASEATIHAMRVEPRISGSPPRLSEDPEFSRYFWNAYENLSVDRWQLVDPSEAVRSDEVIPVLRDYFSEVEIVDGKGSLLHFALFDIAANFAAETPEDLAWLDMLFRIEDTLTAWDDVPMCWASIAARP